MKVILKTGLVPVKMLVSSLPYSNGEVLGLTPDRARKAIAEGVAALVAIPDGYETFESADPVPVAPVAEKQALDDIVIPADWDDEKFHKLKLVALAKKIAGTDVKDAVEAKVIVTAEVERRTAP